MEVSYFFWLKKGVAFFTDPLLLFSVLAASCLLFFKLNQNISFSIKKKVGYVLFFGVWVACTPAFSHLIMAPLENKASEGYFTPGEMEADFILVLGCSHSESEDIPLSSRYAECSMRRVVHAVMLHGETGLPLSFSGGIMPGRNVSEADSNASLAIALGVKKQAVETIVGANDTASESVSVAARRPGARIVLVTTASHILRARRYFEDQGLIVIPSPTDYRNTISSPSFSFPGSYLPHWQGARRSAEAIYEYLGLISQSLGEGS